MKAKKPTTRQGTQKRYALLTALVFVAVFLVGAFVLFIRNTEFAVLAPQGSIAAEQKRLMAFASVLALFVIVPVYIMTFYIAWKYRATNKKAKYTPEWDSSIKAETVWWGIPIALILVLSIVTWQSTHALDPFKPLSSGKRPLNVQVVALQWKWLFIYPDQGIATVNYLKVPTNTPINFKITSDAPMNSFWIPRLGGQVYAMSGMSTALHLDATEPGDYQGVSANLSGEGFADMRFTVSAVEEDQFDTWTAEAQNTTNETLSDARYSYISRPTKNDPQATYRLETTGLYDKIVMKYASHPSDTEGYMGHEETGSMQDMHMEGH